MSIAVRAGRRRASSPLRLRAEHVIVGLLLVPGPGSGSRIGVNARYTARYKVVEQRVYERGVTAARAALGDDTYDRLWPTGHDKGLDEAIAEALRGSEW
jgi:hypothetical protein